MKIIRDYEGGKKVKIIANDIKLAHSTISTILKDKVRVKEAVKASTAFKAIITSQRKELLHEMEKMLAIWFDDQIKKKKNPDEPFDHPGEGMQYFCNVEGATGRRINRNVCHKPWMVSTVSF